MENDGDEKLTLSDWITFLSGEANPAIGNLLGLAAVVLSIAAIINSTTRNNWITIPITLVTLVFVLVVYQLIVHRPREAQRLLKRIMTEGLRDPSEIEKEWKKFLETHKVIKIRRILMLKGFWDKEKDC